MDPLERSIADACFGAHADQELADDLRGFFERRGVATDDVEAILASPRRLAVYRSLVRNAISSVVARFLSQTRRRMNAADPGRFDADFAAFVDQVGPATHHLRDVPAEFFRWAEARWRTDPHLPAYLADLAVHELTRFDVASAPPAGAPSEPAELALDRRLAFADSARIVRHCWAVHELPIDAVEGADPPARRDVNLLAYRDGEHAVQWLELTPLAARMVEALLSAETLGSALEKACAEYGAPFESVRIDTARLLSDLARRGVIVGARLPSL